jgi:hypothetical protein
VGANSLKSTDGGNTWNSLPIAPAAMLLAVATASPESAAITGLGLLAGANQYTTDGQSFRNASEPLVILQDTQDMNVITGGLGFASAGQFTFLKKNATNGVAISTESVQKRHCSHACGVLLLIVLSLCYLLVAVPRTRSLTSAVIRTYRLVTRRFRRRRSGS